jgi:hypothetical protein
MALAATAPCHHEAIRPPTREKKPMSSDREQVFVEEVRTEIDDHIEGRIGGGDRQKPEKTYVIQLNTQDVTMPHHKATGADVKAAAIAQGVAIEADFVLSVQHGDRYDIVGDDDEVTLREGLDFIATAADDNS